MEQNETFVVDVPFDKTENPTYTRASTHVATLLTDRPFVDSLTMRLHANEHSRQERQTQLGAAEGFGIEAFRETATPYAPSLRVYQSVCSFLVIHSP